MTVLLEREHELAVLSAALDAATAAEGSVALIEGQAGVGKTRLLESAVDLARASGFRVFRAVGNELEREFAFGGVLQLFERALPPTGAEREVVFQGAAGLARPLLEGATSDAREDQFPLLHGLFWLTYNLAERGPLLLAVDDMHWLDRPSLRFLAYLAPRLSGLPVMVTGTLRPAEPGAAHDLLAALNSVPGVHRLSPRPLTPKSVEVVVRAQFPAAAPEFSRACAELTTGNPFLLHELMRGVAGTAEPDVSADAAKRLATMAPESALRSVLGQIARLPAGALPFARAAAVLGPGARPHRAARLASLSREVARVAADALIEIEVLSGTSPLRFTHPLLQTIVYEDIAPAERATMHATAARSLADEGAAPSAMASHLLLAEREADSWAVNILEQAAVAALAEGSPESAATYLRRALDEPPPASRRAALLVALGRAEAALGEPEAERHLREAIELSERPADRARITIDLAHSLHGQNRYVEAAEAIERALVDARGNAHLTRELEATWVSVARLAEPLREAAVQRLASIVARGTAETHAERVLLAQASGQRTFAADPREEACALARAALADGRLLEEEGADDQAWFVACGTLAWSEQYDEAERAIERAIEDARRRGRARRFATATYGMHLTRHDAGRLAEAAADAEQALALRHLVWPEYLPHMCAGLASTYMERDDLAAAERVLALPELGKVQSVSAVLVGEARARLHLLRGRAADALNDALESGRRMTSALIVNPVVLQWQSTAALAAAQLGDKDQARQLLDEELRLARRFGAPRPIGVSLRVRGLVEGGDDGIELLREAVSVLQRSPATLEFARALLDLGAILRRSGYRAEARTPLRDALAIAERLGLTAIGKRARDELVASGARPRRRELTGADALTPSERRVAEMAAEGMTNREIAQALFVTVKAVQWHLRNSYRKLDISDRNQLARVLARNR